MKACLSFRVPLWPAMTHSEVEIETNCLLPSQRRNSGILLHDIEKMFTDLAELAKAEALLLRTRLESG